MAGYQHSAEGWTMISFFIAIGTGIATGLALLAYGDLTDSEIFGATMAGFAVFLALAFFHFDRDDR